MSVQITNALVTVNNDPVAIIPNSLMFTEGLGEQSIKAASLGGGQVEQIYANNIEMNFSQIKFEVPSSVPWIKKVREWKANKNQNVVQVTGTTPEGTFSRSFTQAAILNDYEVNLGVDANIPVEFKSNPSI